MPITFLYWLLSMNVVLVLCNGYLLFRCIRIIRQARQADRLLQYLCIQAFGMQSAPIWRAWSETMGDIKVEVNVGRYRWDIDV